ncbi:hypothetical protein JXB31_02425 [Candidatus Woesearchaeota archaeon]|nr:hypothetical protein [Candidatus Woesearchaeota archaeon]
MTQEIITGVDKLVQIIDTAGGRISLKDAMKQMNVSKQLIEEWANTLEESKSICIEYKLFNTYLVRGVSKTELLKKAKDLTLKEEAFEQNLQVNIRDFESESEGLKDIEKEFDVLGDELKKKRSAIEQELKHLYEFDKLNKTFEEELANVDKRSKVYIKDIEKEINDKKNEYSRLLSLIDKEAHEVDEKSKRLNEFLTKAELLNKEINDSKKRISELQAATKNIKPIIKNLESSTVKTLLKAQEDAVKRISDKQKAFLNEIMIKRRFMKIGLKENQMIKQKIDHFFAKQKQLENRFNRLKDEKAAISKELNDIMKLADEYKVIAKRKDVTKEFSNLQERSQQLNARRARFRHDMSEMRTSVKGKKAKNKKR